MAALRVVRGFAAVQEVSGATTDWGKQMKPLDFPAWPGPSKTPALSAEAARQGAFPAWRLPDITRGRLDRMRAGGAPAWLIEAERQAQAQGYTMRRMRGCGSTWYRMPIDEERFEQRARSRQERRLERERGEMPGVIKAPGFDSGFAFDND